jgi:hypothetical protein
VWGLILHKLFGTFLARPKGLLHFLFISEWLTHFPRDAGYPKTEQFRAEIRVALTNGRRLHGIETYRPRGTWSIDDRFLT